MAELTLDPRLRSRADGLKLSTQHVYDLTNAIKADDGPTDPVEVIYVKRVGYLVVDGWYQIAACQAADKERITARITPGTWEDAVLAAASANIQWDRVGLKRTPDDMRRAVEMVLSVKPLWSDGKIAGIAGVSDRYVAGVRAKLQSSNNATGANGSDLREGRDGKTYRVAPGNVPIPREPVRSSTRPEFIEQPVPSWWTNGAAVLPLLKNGIPFPRVLADNQIGLKGVSLMLNRLVDAYSEPVYCSAARRMLTDQEKADRLYWHLERLFREVYADGAPYSDVNFAALESHPELLPRG